MSAYPCTNICIQKQRWWPRMCRRSWRTALFPRVGRRRWGVVLSTRSNHSCPCNNYSHIHRNMLNHTSTTYTHSHSAISALCSIYRAHPSFVACLCLGNHSLLWAARDSDIFCHSHHLLRGPYHLAFADDIVYFCEGDVSLISCRNGTHFFFSFNEAVRWATCVCWRQLARGQVTDQDRHPCTYRIDWTHTDQRDGRQQAR